MNDEEDKQIEPSNFRVNFLKPEDEWFPIVKGSCPICGYKQYMVEGKCSNCSFDSKGHQTYENTFGVSWVNPDGSHLEPTYFGPKPREEFRLRYVHESEATE